ncbi:MAG: DUF1415 domain-containing protein [Gammaproteobacteria bacterium]
MATDEEVVGQTREWVRTVVVGSGFCPFAAQELARNTVRYDVSRATRLEDCLEVFIDGCLRLDKDRQIETSLLVYPDFFQRFEAYLGFVELAEDLLIEQGYEGVYQLASFHPQYCFAAADHDDPANYTNRSPYPMLHLLRESSVELALKGFPGPEQIPQRNIETARTMGLEKMQQMLGECLKPRA